MRHLVTASLLLAAVIHLLPVVGAFGADQLARLYGVQLSDPNLVLLMRHRALLFGLLGVLLAFAAFAPRLQAMAFAAGLVSTASFLLIAWQVGGYNAQIARVVYADLIALAALVVGAVAWAWLRRG